MSRGKQLRPDRPRVAAEMDERKGTPKIQMTATFSELLNRHRSIRRFKPTPIDPELVRRVCRDAVAGASSSGNLNSVSIVLTRDEERKKHLYELHARQSKILQAPLLMTFCADSYRTRRWLSLGKAADNFNNFFGYHIAVIDAMIVAQNVCLGFEAEGLGICYMGTTLTGMPEIAEYLELPDTCVPIATIVAGYPDENPDKRDRLGLEALLHEERYRRPTDKQVDRTYAQREQSAWARYRADPRSAAAMAAHHITTMAQWYCSKMKYDPETFRADSRRLRKLLEEKKFLP